MGAFVAALPVPGTGAVDGGGVLRNVGRRLCEPPTRDVAACGGFDGDDDLVDTAGAAATVPGAAARFADAPAAADVCGDAVSSGVDDAARGGTVGVEGDRAVVPKTSGAAAVSGAGLAGAVGVLALGSGVVGELVSRGGAVGVRLDGASAVTPAAGGSVRGRGSGLVDCASALPLLEERGLPPETAGVVEAEYHCHPNQPAASNAAATATRPTVRRASPPRSAE